MKREENKPFMADLPAGWRELKPLPSAPGPKSGLKALGPKRTLALLALVFFLFSIIFIIPVSYIPALRNLSWRLGFTAQETRSKSFFRTLWDWVSDSERRSRPGSWSGNGGEISLFDRQTQPEFDGSAPASGLFDLRAVNAARRAQGLPADGLAGVSPAPDQAPAAAVTRPVSGWSAQAIHAVRQPVQDMYFGADAAALRAAAEGTVNASSDTASLLPRAGIVGAAASEDKPAVAVGRISYAGDRLGAALRRAVPGARLQGNTGAAQAGEAVRDLDAVLLASYAADNVSDPALKKQLASAGYMAAKTQGAVNDFAERGPAVVVSGTEKVSGSQSADQMQRREQQCQAALAAARGTVRTRLDEAGELIASLYQVPKSCTADMQSWSGRLRSVKAKCNEVNALYNNIREFCGAAITPGRCETNRLDNYESSYNKICAGYENLSAGDKAARAAQLAEAAADIDFEVRDSFNLSVNGEEPGGNDFFPVRRFE